MNCPPYDNVASQNGNDPKTPLSYEQALRALSTKLDAAGLADSEIEARLLLMHASGLGRSQLITHARTPLPAGALAALNALAGRRLRGEPIDHILGWRDFYGRRFTVNKDVLSPRQETEEVLARALELIAAIPAPHIFPGENLLGFLARGEDGLDPYREIAKAAPRHMKPNGWIVLEIGYNQGQSVANIFKAAGFRELELKHDLSGLPRIISAVAPL